jgi:hypothetical protein
MMMQDDAMLSRSFGISQNSVQIALKQSKHKQEDDDDFVHQASRFYK